MQLDSQNQQTDMGNTFSGAELWKYEVLGLLSNTGFRSNRAMMRFTQPESPRRIYHLDVWEYLAWNVRHAGCIVTGVSSQDTLNSWLQKQHLESRHIYLQSGIFGKSINMHVWDFLLQQFQQLLFIIDNSVRSIQN